jgi:hypothetical protein
LAQKEFDIISVVALRKAEFYRGAKKEFLALLPKTLEKNEAMSMLRHAISTVDNSLFIDEAEKISKTVDPKKSVSELKLDRQEIIERVIKNLGVE